MEIFQQSIVKIEPSDFNQDAREQIWHLDLSSDLQSILQSIKTSKDTSIVYCIHGEPGSGCSTLIQGLCQQLCKTNVETESEILYLSLNEGCNEEKFWHFMAQFAGDVNDVRKKDVFAHSFSDDEKKNCLAEFFEEHFKVICIDNGDLFSNFNSFLIDDVLKKCKITSFVVGDHTKHERPSGDIVSNVTVNGLCHSAARALVSKELQQLQLTDDEISSLCCLVNFNPVVAQLACSLLNTQEENAISLLKEDNTAILQKMLESLSKFLKISSISMVCSLCSLRRPLPMLTEHPGLQELVKMKLLCIKQESLSSFPNCIYVHPTIKKHLMKNRMSVNKENIDVDVLMLWLPLVSITLQRLMFEAEDNAWAFVPEKWQYVKDVGEEENYNVKELITSVNATVPSMTEYDVLLECLYHAYIQGDFKKLAAITFILDRFLYWQGDTKTTMDVVDYIQSNSPETAISPQLIIRRARFMKNEGNLRGAEATLDKLLQSKTGVGQWKYKEEQDYQVVCGVCVQIKGEIQYRLGHWQQAASLLIHSIQLFGSLPKPDKKGLSSSYGLLSSCLRNMTISDYFSLVQFYGLVQCNPLLAAYFSAQEASKLSVYTPMFFLRHSCQAGEVMLEFSKLAPTYHEKQLFLRIAIEDLRDSIQAHQTYKSLTSREQFYILVCACYKVSLALMQLESNLDQTRGCTLKKLSLQLYEHYCTTSSHVSIDDQVLRLIDNCLTLLSLESYHTEDLPNAGKVLCEYYTRRSAERLTSGTRLACVGLFSSPQAMFPSTPGKFQVSKQHVYPQEEDTMEQTKRDGINEVVDRNAATMDLQEDVKEKSYLTEMVDRCALTVDHPQTQENRKVPFPKTDNIGSELDDSRNGEDRSVRVSKTVDEFALSVGQTEQNYLHSNVVVQSLEDEATSLLLDQVPIVGHPDDRTLSEDNEGKRAKDAMLWKYDFASSQWRGQPTMACVGDLLKLDKGTKGNQRDVYTVEFINQEEPLGKYVAKKYREQKDKEQYENDVLSQMTARHYVAMFNKSLSLTTAGRNIGEIQFLPVVLLQLVNASGHVTEVLNIEPYMSGEFTKLTNNVDWKNERRRTDLVLAYSHFTYQASNGKLIVVDIQGWVPQDNKGCTFLTDPQIHSPVYKCFGTGNWKKKGFDNFWKMHVECNDICRMLNLVRPPNK